MRIKFEPQLAYQLDAVKSVVNIFKTQEYRYENVMTIPENGIIQNQLSITQKQILTNIQEIQKENGIKPSENLDGMNFSVEMETGTGKTYVYLRTILELNKIYGFKKFIVIVPSVAIREGVLKNLRITLQHFKELYHNTPYSYSEYDSKKIHSIGHFSRSNKIEILVMTIDSFNKDTNIMNMSTDRLSGQKPIDIISKTKPILILDEPQNMESDKAKQAISNLKPLFILRFSATHRNYYNLIYCLTPIDAYEKRLVKKIEVSSVLKEDEFNSPYISCLEIKADTNGVKARLGLNKKLKTGFKVAQILVRSGDDLSRKTGFLEYDGFIVTEISAKYNFVRFANGVFMELGKEVGGDRAKLMQVQIEHTIGEHFRKHCDLKQYGIKVLSLFFIDRVDNYFQEEGIIRKYFVDAFNKLKQQFDDFKDVHVNSVHRGYFSKSRNTKLMEEDREAFDLIMKDKERLLSFEEPVQFIFSHSALREGWDNPNVFNICTLNETISKIKKRQEIGRGMRLPVNQDGERMLLGEHNVLTVIANESYAEYVSKLQHEYAEEYGDEVVPPKPLNAKNRTVLALKKGYQLDPDFKELWKRVSKRTKYAIKINSDSLITQCVREINKISVNALKIKIETVSLALKEGKGVIYDFTGTGCEVLDKNFSIPNILDSLSNETNLSRKTLVEILSKLENFHLIFRDPQVYITSVTLIIKEKLADLLVDGIKYSELNDSFKMELFNDIETYRDFIIPIKKSIYEGVIWESKTERNFAEALDEMKNVKLFIKLPDWFKVNTPIGDYNPDWAVVMQRRNQFGELQDTLYFVTETKGTTDVSSLRLSEMRKIECAKRHFRSIDVDYRIVSNPEELLET